MPDLSPDVWLGVAIAGYVAAFVLIAVLDVRAATRRPR